MADLRYLDRPSLRDPTLIMAFSGWPNAGEIATGTADYIKSRLGAHPLAAIDTDPFYDFTDSRPTAVINNGYVEEITSTSLYIYHTPTAAGEPDLIIASSPEPQMRWKYFTNLVYQMVEDFGVRTVFTLGGTYDYVPHWLPATVSAVFSDHRARTLLPPKTDITPAVYHGPVSIHTAILIKGREMNLPVIGLWGHSPVYIQNGFIKMHQRLVEILKKAVGFTLDTSELVEDIVDMDRQIEEAVDKNPGLRKYLDELKEDYESLLKENKPTPHKHTGFERGKVISLEDFLNKNND